MVQLFYYENRGKCCHKILRYEGYRSKILLFPYEGWAHPASLSYWILKTPWWSRKRCKIIEVCGTRKTSTRGKLIDSGNGTMYVVGKFRDTADPDFKLVLSSHVSSADFQLGYSMTGTLERGTRREGQMEMTHFAMIKRKGY